METITIKINTKSNKGKYLLGLIKEMAKDETFVKIEPNIEEEIKVGLEQVKKIKSGALPQRTLKQMLNNE